MKKALAMKCTQEQWDSIKGRIPEEITKDMLLYNDFNCITNIYFGHFISNIGYGDGTYKGLKIHETFNAKIFLDACGIETDVYEITKEQVLELSKMNCVIKEKLCDLFPDAFKKELEVGKWYKVNTEHFVYLLLYSGKTLSLGFYDGKWGSWAFTKDSNQTKAIEATRQEVEAALISEAKKMGFKKGVRYLSAWNNEAYCIYPQDLYYNAKKNCLATHNGNECVFKNGKWATIIQPEKMTLEQIEKELGRKIQIV